VSEEFQAEQFQWVAEPFRWVVDQEDDPEDDQIQEDDS
jgi:hypothetical protein